MSHVDDGMLHAYLDGELTPADARGVDAHLAQCPDCRRRLDEERALIARAAELLALATPPDRELPPLRAGDVKPSTRVWWQVRLPLAWAATVLLALGIGRYYGSRSAAYRPQVATSQAAPVMVADSLVPARSRALPQHTLQRAPSPVPAAPPAVPPAAPAPTRALADSIAPLRAEAVVPPTDSAAAAYAERRSLDAVARSIVQRKASRDERDPWEKGNAISVDSARRVLGANPLVVPGVPIEAIYHGRRIGFSGVVIVEQALDSATMIEVINARPAPLLLDQIVVAGAPAAVADSFSAARRGVVGARIADSLEAFPRGAAPTPLRAPVPARPELFRDVRGSLSPDSLAALRRRLQPLPPATEP